MIFHFVEAIYFSDLKKFESFNNLSKHFREYSIEAFDAKEAMMRSYAMPYWRFPWKPENWNNTFQTYNFNDKFYVAVVLAQRTFADEVISAQIKFAQLAAAMRNGLKLKNDPISDIDPVTSRLMASALKTHGYESCPKCGSRGSFVRMALVCKDHGTFGGC